MSVIDEISKSWRTNFYDSYHRDCFLSVSMKESGFCLHIAPKFSDLQMDNSSFQICCPLRLGIPMPMQLPVQCNFHVLTCAAGGGVQSRHKAVQQVLHQLGFYAGIPSILKDRTLVNFFKPTDASRGDILFQGLGENCRNLLVEVTIGYPSYRLS